jgi:hypothetical protein
MDVGEIISKECLPQNRLLKQLQYKRYRRSFTNCPKLYVPPQNSTRQKASKKQVRYRKAEILGANVKKLVPQDT